MSHTIISRIHIVSLPSYPFSFFLFCSNASFDFIFTFFFYLPQSLIFILLYDYVNLSCIVHSTVYLCTLHYSFLFIILLNVHHQKRFLNSAVYNRIDIFSKSHEDIKRIPIGFVISLSVLLLCLQFLYSY